MKTQKDEYPNTKKYLVIRLELRSLYFLLEKTYLNICNNSPECLVDHVWKMRYLNFFLCVVQFYRHTTVSNCTSKHISLLMVYHGANNIYCKPKYFWLYVHESQYLQEYSFPFNFLNFSPSHFVYLLLCRRTRWRPDYSVTYIRQVSITPGIYPTIQSPDFKTPLLIERLEYFVPKFKPRQSPLSDKINKRLILEISNFVSSIIKNKHVSKI